MHITLWLQLVSAWRSTRAAWRHALLSTALLALGIAATVTVFALVKVMLIDPLPYRDQERLVHLHESRPPEFPRFAVAPGKFAVWEAQSRSFESMALYARTASLLSGTGTPARLDGVMATSGLFATLGTQAYLGRTFQPGDAAAGEAPVVLGYQAWQRVFGGDPDILGRRITLDQEARTVIGVMPADFAYPGPAVDIYTLWRLGPQELAAVGEHMAHAVARLRSGATLAQAQAEMAQHAERFAREYPDSSRGWQVEIVPLREDIVGEIRPQLLLLLAGVALLLAIACANVASLTLVRVNGRLHEFAVRRSQGASAAHLGIQQALEGGLLGTVAGTLACGLVAAALKLIQALSPVALPQIERLQLDGTLAMATLALSIAAAMLAAVLPALWALRRSIVSDIRSGARAIAGHGARGRGALIVAEIALAVVLLSGAGALARSLWTLTTVDPGFAVDAGLHTQIDLPPGRYEGAAAADVFARLSEELAAVPGVDGAALTQNLPMVSDYWVQVERAGRPAPSRDAEPTAMYYAVTPGYLDTLGVRLLRGRGFTDADRSGAPGVLLVSEGFAQRYFPGEDPIGKRMRQVSGEELPWLEIVGVVADVRHYGLDREAPPAIYEPIAQAPFASAHLLVKTRLAPVTLAAALQPILREIDADVPLGSVMTTASMVSNGLLVRRFLTWLIAGFAVSALLLASVGLYAALSWLVSQRTRDIGVRLALGARRADVLGWVLREGLRLAVAGAAVGLAVAVAAAQVLDGMLYGVGPRDPLTLGSIALCMLLIALAAALLPALRATRVAPAMVLRGE